MAIELGEEVFEEYLIKHLILDHRMPGVQFGDFLRIFNNQHSFNIKSVFFKVWQETGAIWWWFLELALQLQFFWKFDKPRVSGLKFGDYLKKLRNNTWSEFIFIKFDKQRV